MTNREFFEAIINVNINDELTAFAQAGIDKLDTTNSRRREAATKRTREKEAERAPIRDAIVGVMTAEPKTASTLIAEAGVEIKPQTIPSLLRGLIADGVIVKGDVKVTGKGKAVGYALV